MTIGGGGFSSSISQNQVMVNVYSMIVMVHSYVTELLFFVFGDIKCRVTMATEMLIT